MKYFRHYPAEIQSTKIKGRNGSSIEICSLYMGKGRRAHFYTRTKLSMKDILRGRRATLPWRRVWTK